MNSGRRAGSEAAGAPRSQSHAVELQFPAQVVECLVDTVTAAQSRPAMVMST